MCFFNGIRTTSIVFGCTTSIMHISDSPECLLLQDFHLYPGAREDHGLLADQEHQEYQKVPVESAQQTGMKRAQRCWTLPSPNSDPPQHSAAKTDRKSTHHFTLATRASSSSRRALKKDMAK